MAKAVGLNPAQIKSLFKESSASVGGPLLFASRPGNGNDSAEEAIWHDRITMMMQKNINAELSLADDAGVIVPHLQEAQKNFPNFMAWRAH
ncbi:hypothetical protein [Croceicoccus naphthovorans]|uniref:hypothetical protein n=1 Tax=Croceicoccus naphthovorans TaxID=1348774 RepID=UPI0012E056A5|nr:hypothetical protein [Croceicoccus naphthovorans]MBB3988933.1 hypothetical protein [Croceicoccus naphthovorans]